MFLVYRLRSCLAIKYAAFEWHHLLSQCCFSVNRFNRLNKFISSCMTFETNLAQERGPERDGKSSKASMPPCVSTQQPWHWISGERRALKGSRDRAWARGKEVRPPLFNMLDYRSRSFTCKWLSLLNPVESRACAESRWGRKLWQNKDVVDSDKVSWANVWPLNR